MAKGTKQFIRPLRRSLLRVRAIFCNPKPLVQDLRRVSDRSNERILSWRELLKDGGRKRSSTFKPARILLAHSQESSHAIDSLGGALAQTQTAVRVPQGCRQSECAFLYLISHRHA